jgi:hypothetical protein
MTWALINDNHFRVDPSSRVIVFGRQARKRSRTAGDSGGARTAAMFC